MKDRQPRIEQKIVGQERVPALRDVQEAIADYKRLLETEVLNFYRTYSNSMGTTIPNGQTQMERDNDLKVHKLEQALKVLGINVK